MKRHMLAAGVALAALFVAAQGGAATAAQEVPFSGSLEGSADTSAFPAVVVHATGTATHLGQFTFTMPHVVLPPPATLAPTVPPSATPAPTGSVKPTKKGRSSKSADPTPPAIATAPVGA